MAILAKWRRIITMKMHSVFKNLSFIAVFALFCGCAGTGEKASTGEGIQLLDTLKAGISMDEVIRVLGEPTTYTGIRRTSDGETHYEMTYVDTIINPGVVELYFQPGLIEIRLDTRLYRDLGY